MLIQRTQKAAPLISDVSAPSEAWRILQGESPCRERPNPPPVSSVAPVAELDFKRTRQVKRTQRIVQAVGSSQLLRVGTASK